MDAITETLQNFWLQIQILSAKLLPDLTPNARVMVMGACALFLFFALFKGVVKFFLALAMIIVGLMVLAYMAGVPAEEFIKLFDFN